MFHSPNLSHEEFPSSFSANSKRQSSHIVSHTPMTDGLASASLITWWLRKSKNQSNACTGSPPYKTGITNRTYINIYFKYSYWRQRGQKGSRLCWLPMTYSYLAKRRGEIPRNFFEVITQNIICIRLPNEGSNTARFILRTAAILLAK